MWKGRDLAAREVHSPALATCMPTAGRAQTTQTTLTQSCEPKRKREKQTVKEKADRKYLLLSILQS